MNKLEKDILTIMIINENLPKGLVSILPEYDKEIVINLLPKLKIMSNEESSEKALIELAKESWNRILKKANT